jgi:hypothetical protein
VTGSVHVTDALRPRGVRGWTSNRMPCLQAVRGLVHITVFFLQHHMLTQNRHNRTSSGVLGGLFMYRSAVVVQVPPGHQFALQVHLRVALWVST